LIAQPANGTAQDEPHLVQREDRHVGTGHEDGRADDAVLHRERADQPVGDGAAQHRHSRSERRTLLAQPTSDDGRDLVDRKSLAGPYANDVRGKHVRDRVDLTRRDRDDRNTRTARAPQRALVVRRPQHVHVHGSASRLVVRRDGTRIRTARKVAAEERRELTRAADDERLCAL
jgi:hypothetical protein